MKALNPNGQVNPNNDSTVNYHQCQFILTLKASTSEKEGPPEVRTHKRL